MKEYNSNSKLIGYVVIHIEKGSNLIRVIHGASKKICIRVLRAFDLISLYNAWLRKVGKAFGSDWLGKPFEYLLVINLI
jgi:hypothetical protein